MMSRRNVLAGAAVAGGAMAAGTGMAAAQAPQPAPARALQPRVPPPPADGTPRISMPFFARAHPDALLVPSVAVLQSLEAISVFTVEDGRAVRRTVETGGKQGGNILHGRPPRKR